MSAPRALKAQEQDVHTSNGTEMKLSTEETASSSAVVFVLLLCDVVSKTEERPSP